MTEILDGYSSAKCSSSVNLKDLVAEIVSNYVANNQIDKEEIPELFQMVFQSLSSLTYRKGGLLTFTSEPAVPIENSIHPDYLACLEDGRWKMEDGRWKMEDGRWKMEDGRWKMEDGRWLKMLRRHLRTAYNMNPEQYCLHWNLLDNSTL